MNHCLLKAEEVLERTGMSRTTLYQMINKGLFPKQLQTTIRSVRWLERDVNDWIASRCHANNQPPTAKQPSANMGARNI